MKLNYVFPTPVLQIKFKNHLDYQFSNIPEGVKKPENWIKDLYTTFPNIEDDDPYVSSIVRDKLKDDLKNSINEFFNLCKMPTNWNYSEFWYNVYYNNQGQEKHRHLTEVGLPSNYWSGVYYHKGNTPTTFVRECNFYETQYFPGWMDTELKEFYYKTWYPDIEEGDIILFPPYLKHYVDYKSDSNQMRMTFSFNIVLNSLS